LNRILPWLRANVVTVIMLVLMLAAVITAPLLAGRWNESVRKDAEARAARLNAITSIERTSVTVAVPGQPPRTVTTVVNPQLLARYRELSDSLQDDAKAVRRAAVEFNRKDRGLLVPRLFPAIPPRERETLPVQIPDVMARAYRDLLSRVGAGSPPAPDAVVEAIATREAQFISNNLRKQSRSDLEPNELRDLKAELTKARLAKYGERAEEIAFYARFEDMPVPARPTGRLPSMREMFEWQWDFWLVEDLVKAVAAANASSESVVTAPVKRIVSLAIIDPLPTAPAPAAGGTGQGGGAGPAGGFGAMPGGGPTGGASGGAAPSAPSDEPLGTPVIDSATPVSRNFGASLTGRTSNHLFDVRRAEMRLVCATSEIPAVIDAFARRNFITVLDLELRAADPFEAVEYGYIYGTEPVSELRLLLETVWLREWTAPFMPREIRTALGVGSSSASSAPDAVVPGAAPAGRTEEEELEALLGL